MNKIKKNIIKPSILAGFMEGLSLGAKGYLLKDTTREELIRTVESAIREETLLQPEISKSIFSFKKGTKQSNNPY